MLNQVDLVFEKKYHLPEFPLPEEYSEENAYLEHLALEGAKQRYGDAQTLMVDQTEPRGVTVRIRLPLEYAERSK